MRPPLILVTADVEAKGKEFEDLSLSLSLRYERALTAAGAVPLILPATTDRAHIAACVRACDGVMLTGGDDVDPRVYGGGFGPEVLRTVEPTPDGGARDYREVQLLDEVFRQRKPLLAICRGHQLLNVALGGTLVADLPQQRPKALNHRRMDRRCDPVHEVTLTPDSLLSKITGAQKLGVNSTHHQAVDRLAAPLRATATSMDGIVEAMELRADAGFGMPFLLSVQFHPERLADRHPEHGAIFRAFAHVCARGGFTSYEGQNLNCR